MSDMPSYYIRRGDLEEGPFSAPILTRLKQQRKIRSDTPCRGEHEAEFKRLDEIFPHLKDHQGMDPETLTQLKEDMARDDSISLMRTGGLAGILFWLPIVGIFGSFVAMGCGAVLAFKYRNPIGALIFGLGLLGFGTRILLFFH